MYLFLTQGASTTHLHGSEPRVFLFGFPGIEPSRVTYIGTKIYISGTLFGWDSLYMKLNMYIYIYIYIIWQWLLNHSDLEWLFEDFWNTPTACFVRISPRGQNESRRWVQTSPRNSSVPLCLTEKKRWGCMWRMIRHAYKSARNKCDFDHIYIYIYIYISSHIYIYKYYLQYMDSGLIFSESPFNSWDLVSVQMPFHTNCLKRPWCAKTRTEYCSNTNKSSHQLPGLFM